MARSTPTDTTRRRQVLGLFLALLIVTVGGTLAGVATAASPRAANANFVGAWHVSQGVDFTISTEDASGACTGIGVYPMTACQVTGDAYTFTLTTGGYVSVNTGTISGDSLTGEFHDSNGTMEDYTATRAATSLKASFTVSKASTTAGQYQFVSTTTDEAGATIDYSWAFGDGGTGTGAAVTHTYAKPGTFTATLSVKDDQGRSDTATQSVVVAAPSLTVTPTIAGGNQEVAPGDPATVTVEVQTGDGVGDLTGVKLAKLDSAPTSAISILSGPTPALPTTLKPNQDLTVSYAIKAGTDQVNDVITAAATASDAAGHAVSASGTTHLKIVSHVLAVTLTAAPDPSTLSVASDGTVTPENLTVTETITNTGKTAVTAVNAGPLALAAADPTQPYDPFPASITGGNADTAEGTIAAGKAASLTRTVTVTDGAALALTAPVTSDQDSLTGHGTLTAKLPGLDVGWTMDPTFDDTSATVVSTNAQLHPKDGYGLTAHLDDGCTATNATTFAFTVGGKALAVTPARATCTWAFSRPNLDAFTLKAKGKSADGSTVTGTEKIAPRQFLIVAMGDSLSSGEGEPASTWVLPQCHRSLQSGSAKAALQLEQADPHTSVAYVSVACSGADTDEGLLGSYPGIANGPEPLEPQISDISSIVKDTPIDAVVFSIGANDIQFGQVAKRCIERALLGCDASTSLGDTTIGNLLVSGFRALPGNYARVADALDNLGVPAGRVTALTYPDSTHDTTVTKGTQNFCSYPPMTQSSWQFNYQHVLEPLNAAVVAASQAHGWNVIAGAPAAFLNHGYCASDTWITTLGASGVTELVPDGAFHPNDEGYDWYGSAIYDRLDGELYQADGTPVPAGSATNGSAGGAVSDDSVTPGQTDTASGDGFDAGETVTATLHSVPVHLGSAVADADGQVSLTVLIPLGTLPGAHHVILTGERSGRTVSIPLTVVTASAVTTTSTSTTTTSTPSSSDTLPFTGEPSAALARWGLWLSSGGLIAFVLGTGGSAMLRRRRS